ncbi:MAG: TetR/AcrR family transcriptional regulator [Myxococcota bacterium]
MPNRRRRRAPEAARAEILEAAEAALREVDLAGLTVELLMERTGMTRSSFYHYFKRLDEVVLALRARRVEVSGAVDAWLEGAAEDASAEARRRLTVERLTRMYEVWQQHATLMRAMEQSAGRGGAAYEGWRTRVVEGYVEKTSAFLRREIAAGRSHAPDPEALARTLILMNLSVATGRCSGPIPIPPSASAPSWGTSGTPQSTGIERLFARPRLLLTICR